MDYATKQSSSSPVDNRHSLDTGRCGLDTLIGGGPRSTLRAAPAALSSAPVQPRQLTLWNDWYLWVSVLANVQCVGGPAPVATGGVVAARPQYLLPTVQAR